jgi:hypothetical protein
MQFLFAAWAYVYPGWSSSVKRGYGPGHIFGGLMAYVLGLATMAVRFTIAHRLIAHLSTAKKFLRTGNGDGM